MSKLQRAQFVPGLKFRNRQVYLEQFEDEDDSTLKETGKVMQDCLIFAKTVRELLDEHKDRERGLIIVPGSIEPVSTR